MQSPTMNRKQPLLGERVAERRSMAEVAGGATAGCVAVWCCFPCSVMNLVVMAAYKVPAGLCRKAMQKKRRKRQMKRKKKAMEQQQMPPRLGRFLSFDESEIDWMESEVEDGDEATATANFETEMWSQFSGAGFWRSPSQKEQ
ncbi:uncharacterized protein LOC127797422 [Diospyros lotus]|uniref:uncharacterized protein LOC127797422 n=1 Tax=Diospyros lotus TaxID=55363 RepID=UPI00225B8E78|nr:uncharacterized protein LOC127797422 [Diospyros lotus]